VFSKTCRIKLEKRKEKRKNISKISKEARAISEDSCSSLKQSHEDSHT
jgi:hypothetical protein